MGDKYASERGEQPSPTCGNSSLLFDGSYLKLFAGPVSGGTATKSWHARSGHKVSGKFDYSDARQRVSGEGPIPAGAYWIQASQLRVFLIDDDGWGDSRITIHPTTATNTYSRGGFFIHGGERFGSAGCIDLAHGMKSFRRNLQSMAPWSASFWSAPKPNPCTISLTVEYAATSVGDP